MLTKTYSVSECETKLYETVSGARKEDPNTKREYELTFLEEQIKSITAQRDEMIQAKERELKEVKELLAQAKNLGVKPAPTPEPKPEPIKLTT